MQQFFTPHTQSDMILEHSWNAASAELSTAVVTAVVGFLFDYWNYDNSMYSKLKAIKSVLTDM